MTPRLPPRKSLPDIVSDAALFCARNGRLLAPIVVAVAVASGAANYLLLEHVPQLSGSETPTNEQIRETMMGATPYLSFALLVQMFAHLALVWIALRHFRAQEVSPMAAIGAALRAYPAAFVASLVMFLTGVMLAATLILMPLALYLLICWLFATQSLMEGGVGPFAALARSWSIVRGSWWRVCGVGLAVLVLSLLPGIILAQVAGVTDSSIGAAVAAAVAAAVGTPFLATGHTLLYLDVLADKARAAGSITGGRMHL